MAVMSALPPKADMCSAVVHVHFGPKAVISAFNASRQKKYGAQS